MVEACSMTLEEVARVATEAVTPPAGTEATWTAKGSPSRVKLALHFVSYRDDAGACHEVDIDTLVPKEALASADALRAYVRELWADAELDDIAAAGGLPEG